MVRTSVIAILLALGGCGGFGSARYETPHVASTASYGGEAVPSAERYEAAPEGGMIETAQDARVTFSLDVDTASYTLMRRDLTAGSLPNPEGVRVEEYLNFFRFDDIPNGPTGDAPFGVLLESAPSPFGDGMHLLRVGVRATDVPTEQRPAANLVFLIDVSGSMAEADKLPLVQYSLSTLVDSLRPDDTIGIVVYAGTEGVALEPTPVRERGRILSVIQSLGASGSTNGEAGMRRAYDLAAQHFRAGGINRVIWCSDGDFNVGVTGDELIRLVEAQRDRGITLTTLGFGSGNYNDREMERMADRGNGNYAYIDTRNEALRMLGRDLAGTLQVVAKDVKVQVELDPAVVRELRLIGYDNRRLQHDEFRDDAVDAAEVGSGQFVTALIEYRLQPNVQPGNDPRAFAEVRVRWKAPDHEQGQELSQSIELSRIAPAFDAASPQLRFSAAVAELAEILRHSRHSQGARFADVLRIARGAAFSQDHDVTELADLVERAQRLWPNDG